MMVINSKQFDNLRAELAEIFSKAEYELEGAHSIDTLEWVLKIKPYADETLQIAALAHDIDRAVPPMIKKAENESYDDYKQKHADRSSQIITELMKKYDYIEEDVNKVRNLVINHEVGGDEEANILMDADSVSFFSCNIDWYYKHKNYDLEKTKMGIKYKYDRATQRAKELIKTIKIKNSVLAEACVEVFK